MSGTDVSEQPPCVHCGVPLKLDEEGGSDPGWGRHASGSQQGMFSCGSESGQPYGLGGHTADVSCSKPCTGTHVAGTEVVGRL